MARGVLIRRRVDQRARDGDVDHRVDVLVYVLWAAVLLFLLRYI